MTLPYVEQLLTGKVKQMGQPHAIDKMDRPWESGIFKSAVEGPVWLGERGLEGDEVADLKNHGGPEKAVFAYPLKHYDYWQNDIENESIGQGGFGENLSVTGVDEFSVCIGDTYRFGEVIVQVSQPRRPCWKPARRFRVLDLALRIQYSGKTGWYYRVLQTGPVQAGVHLELLERPYPQWTIAACNKVMYIDKEDYRLAADLAACELLSANWKRTLNKRLDGQKSSIHKRVFGPNQ